MGTVTGATHAAPRCEQASSQDRASLTSDCDCSTLTHSSRSFEPLAPSAALAWAAEAIRTRERATIREKRIVPAAREGRHPESTPRPGQVNKLNTAKCCDCSTIAFFLLALGLFRLAKPRENIVHVPFPLSAKRIILAAMTRQLESGSREIARPGHPASAGASYDLPRTCAIFKKPYIARYTRGANGRFTLAGTFKTMAPGEGREAPRLAFDYTKRESDSLQERCVWCGHLGKVLLCRSCGVVCSGAVRESDGKQVCKCACGKLSEVTGTFTTSPCTRAATGAESPARPALASSQDRKAALPGTDRLRLKS